MKKSIMKATMKTLIASGVLSVFLALPAQAETYEYDKLNRLTKVVYDDGSCIEYEYDANGNMTMTESEEKSQPEDSDTPQTPSDEDDVPQKPTEDEDTPKVPSDDDTQKEEDKKDSGATEEPKAPAQTPPVQKDSIIKVVTKTAYYSIYNIDTKNQRVVLTKLKSKKKTSYTIPTSITYNGKKYPVTEIGGSAFAKQKKLKKVTIGKNVQKIGKKAFYNASKLKKIVVKSKKLKSVGKNAFKGIHKNAVIKVPSKKLKAYKKLFKKKGQKSTVKIKK